MTVGFSWSVDQKNQSNNFFKHTPYSNSSGLSLGWRKTENIVEIRETWPLNAYLPSRDGRTHLGKITENKDVGADT